MPGVVNIPKVRQIAGGVLGEQSKALRAIRDALEGMKGDYPIKIVACGKNSFKVTSQGDDGGVLPDPLVENHLIVATLIPATETVPAYLEWRDGVLRALPDEEE